MPRKISQDQLLSNTISALEQLLLSATDQEILSDVSDITAATNDIRILISKKLAHENKTVPSCIAEPRKLRTKKRQVPRHSKTVPDQLALLSQLAVNRPELSFRLRAVFDSGKAPTDKQVDELTKELIELGLLPKTPPRGSN